MISIAGSPLAAKRFDALVLGAAALLLLSIVFGGGGAEGPTPNGWLEAFGAILMMAAAASHFAARPLPSQATVPVWLAVATLAVIAAQLIPLPWSVWTTLPGRETAVAVSTATGGSTLWRPLSLDPEATRRAGAALLVPIALFLAAVGASRAGIVLLLKTLIVGALLSAVLGAIQISLGTPEGLAPYGNSGPGVASGLFANANHHAQLMLAAIIATGLLIRLEDPQVRIRRIKGDLVFHLAWLLFPIFIAVTVATQSRAGLALMVPALVAAIVLAISRRGPARLFTIFVLAAAVVIALIAFAPGSTARIMKLQTSLMGEDRVISLPDIQFTLAQYWPFGSGFGTFAPVFQSNEDLDLVMGPRLNHAHNDLLEILVEAGIAGAVLLVAAGLALAARSWSLIRAKRTTDTGIALGGVAMLTLMLLHSLVDYPMRMHAIAAVAGLAIALFVAPPQKREAPSSDRSRQRRKGFAGASSRGPSQSRRVKEW